MGVIKWRDSYSVGVEQFDNEHKMLVAIINDLFVIVRDKGELEETATCIDKLIQYTREHFRDEEEAMDETNYPLMEEHKSIHNDLLNSVENFKERINNAEDMVTQELYLFLREWLLKHILEEDIKYKEHFQLSQPA